MSHDPRAIANAILDEADRQHLEITNLSLNKILYFAHANHLVFHNLPLVSLTFEAWQHGPVMPVVYHQFKHHKNQAITSRTYKICPQTGSELEFCYQHLDIDFNFISRIVNSYGSKSAHVLRAMSHAPGEAWDLVWNLGHGKRFGMAIPDHLISRTFSGTQTSRVERQNAH